MTVSSDAVISHSSRRGGGGVRQAARPGLSGRAGRVLSCRPKAGRGLRRSDSEAAAAAPDVTRRGCNMGVGARCESGIDRARRDQPEPRAESETQCAIRVGTGPTSPGRGHSWQENRARTRLGAAVRNTLVVQLAMMCSRTRRQRRLSQASLTRDSPPSSPSAPS